MSNNQKPAISSKIVRYLVAGAALVVGGALCLKFAANAGQAYLDPAWVKQMTSLASSVSQDKDILGLTYGWNLYPRFMLEIPSLLVMPLFLVALVALFLRNGRLVDRIVTSQQAGVAASLNQGDAEKKARMLELQLKEVRDQAARMHERISDGFLYISNRADVLYMNRHAKRILEEKFEFSGSYDGQNMESVMPGYTDSDLALTVSEVLDSRRPKSVETHISGQNVWIAANVYPASNGVYVYFQDISRQKNVTVKVQASLSLLRQVIDTAPEALAITDTNWQYLAVNRSWLRGFKLEEGSTVGLNHGDVLPDTMADLPEIAARVKQGDVYETAEHPYRVGGREEWIRWRVRPWWDDDDHLSGFIIVAVFTTEQRKLQQRAERQREQERRLAYHDALTGLPNRQLFYDRLNQALAQAYRNTDRVALMFLDLDGFKGVNDSLGHDVGDMLLKEVSARLLTCVRQSDTVARLGGDEFTVILNGIKTPDDAVTVAQKIINTIDQPFELGGNSVRVTTSVGIGIYPNDGSTAADLTKCADSAMYEAKQSGKNQFRFYTQADTTQLKEEPDLQERLRQAMKANELELHYQPQIDAETKNVVAVEALLRWRHPDLGLLKPNDFLAEAEEHDVIFELAEWVLREACTQNRAWHQEGHPVQVTVNLSPRQFRSKDLTDVISRVLSETGLEPKHLGLEMTESLVIQNDSTTLDTLNKLKLMGLELIIDDFGTSFTSMSRLKNFPVDTLKIHQSFVHGLETNKEDQAIIKTIITLAENMNLNVVAEGVEKNEQAEFLIHNGCKRIQGFLYGQPVRPGKATAFFNQGQKE